MRFNSKKIILALLLVFLVGIFGIQATAQEVTLDFAHATVGGAFRVVLDQIITDFEQLHPNIRIRENVMKDEIYETVGLISLFKAATPPDVYFQWGGWLVERDVSEGWAADLTEEMNRYGWKKYFSDGAWEDAMVNGRIYLVPHNMDVTNLIWYNKEIFDRFGLSEPQSWPEFLEICSKLQAEGVLPIAAGNKGVGWPMGNWAGHIVSRMIGEKEYNDLLKLKPGTSFSDEGVVAALELLSEMVEKEYFNEGVNVIDSMEARMIFFMGEAAMHPIGSWLVPSARRDAPELVYRGFDTPAIPDGEGDQTSMIGLTVGYMVGEGTPHFDEAVAFLRYLTSVPVQRHRVRETGEVSAVRFTADAAVDPAFHVVAGIAEHAGSLVAPPDTGYELEVAYAFYDAVAKVMDGVDPVQALEEADVAIEHLRP